MPRDFKLTGNADWHGLQEIEVDSYTCGYCSQSVSSNRGMRTGSREATLRVCPQCNAPTFFAYGGMQTPGPRHGGAIEGVEKEVKGAYDEARACITVNAFTAAVMMCRKILMNVAVSKEAKEGLQFASYVQWLVDEGYAPKGSDGWLKYVKDRGNEANHEIVPMKREDAVGVLRFTEQLLRNMFELPLLVPTIRAPESKPGSNAP